MDLNKFLSKEVNMVKGIAVNMTVNRVSEFVEDAICPNTASKVALTRVVAHGLELVPVLNQLSVVKTVSETLKLRSWVLALNGIANNL